MHQKEVLSGRSEVASVHSRSTRLGQENGLYRSFMSNFYRSKKAQDPLAAKAGADDRLKRAYQFLKGKEKSLQNSDLKAEKNPASQR